MKQILLMRHAKSSWSDAGLKDYDRPLEERGMQDAPLMGKLLLDTDYKPGIIISSPAKRALETTQLIIESANIGEEKISFNDDLYFGSVQDYLAAIRSASDKTDRIMLVGHNPLMESTVRLLSGAGDIRMPTAAMVCLESLVDTWGSVNPESCYIKWMMIPKVLKKM